MHMTWTGFTHLANFIAELQSRLRHRIEVPRALARKNFPWSLWVDKYKDGSRGLRVKTEVTAGIATVDVIARLVGSSPSAHVLQMGRIDDNNPGQTVGPPTYSESSSAVSLDLVIACKQNGSVAV